jgi:ribonuclease HIII
VANQTLVLRVPPSEQAQLRARLSQGTFEHRSVPHALFSVKGEGVVATLYTSGKLVVQGSDPLIFVARFVPESAQAEAPAKERPKTSAAPTTFDRPTVGSDESGKGDFFGPLVVAAVRLEPSEAQQLLDAGVMDSKKLSDARALKLGAWLREHAHHSLQVLEPAEYNARWREEGLHTLLSDLHARAIRGVAARGDRVVIDQFSKKDEIGPALAGLGLDIERRTRAESELAVAAASILARAEFLVRLMELGEEAGLALPKGAGALVDEAAAELARRTGPEALAAFAKVHFKNVDKVRGRL